MSLAMMILPPCESPGASVTHPHRVHRWLSVVVLAGALSGCIESNLVECDNGLACPATERCDDVHHTCVLPEQLRVCQGASDGTDCTTGPVSGGCFDSVCLPRGCGNRVVEPGEMCDDGNQISGDGCSGDCRSTEQCGNGFVDPGEPCDDGNLMSRDGCDSRCNIEDAVWSDALAIAPSSIDAQYTAYDAARERLVYASGGGTWEWDGTRWTFAPLPANAEFLFEAVFYDADRARVCMIGTSLEGNLRLYAWTDGRWQAIDRSGGPTLTGFPPQMAVVHDAARHRMMMIETATGAVWTIDDTGAWVSLPAVPGAPGEAAAVFDAASSEIVLETTASVEWVYNGTAWASTSTRFSDRVSLAFDPDRGRVVLVDNVARKTYERVDGAWSAIDGADVPCLNKLGYLSLPMYYDHQRAALSLFSSSTGDICRWDHGWTRTSPPLPFSPIGATYDPVSGNFVVLHNARPEDPTSPTEMWMLGPDGWQPIATSEPPHGRSSPLAVYAAGRAATVLYGEQLVTNPDDEPSTMPCSDQAGYAADTWSFDGASWRALSSFTRGGAPCSNSAATYDATHHRVVLATYNELWGLADTDGAWQRLATPLSVGHVFNLAWDARNQRLTAARLADGIGAPLFDLRDGDWAPIEIMPSGLNSSSNALISDLRAGTVIVIDNNDGRAWERAGAEWHRLPDAPIGNLFVSWTAYDPSRGRMLYLGRRDNGTFAATLTRTSATPLETCRAGEDADGDGLAGCDDPDCAWDCH
jgi:cysteine-rich repeat protein